MAMSGASSSFARSRSIYALVAAGVAFPDETSALGLPLSSSPSSCKPLAVLAFFSARVVEAIKAETPDLMLSLSAGCPSRGFRNSKSNMFVIPPHETIF